MKRVRVSHPARQDRLEIWLHIAADNQDAADRLIEEIDETPALLAASPNPGRARPEIGPRIRHFPVGNHLVFYLPVPDGIAVLRILHGARHLEGQI